jgi:succinoglycan biosynthesis protein ExoM
VLIFSEDMKPPHITVCICTFRRPKLLGHLLSELARQETENRFTFSIVVCDNDEAESARPIAAEFAACSSLETTYCAEPRQNIALARNRTLEHAKGDYIAFIDDDEFPASDWLRRMLATCERLHVAGVLGPVRPHFDEAPPGWVLDGRFCERPEYPTGTVMHWSKSRTGNLLFRRNILHSMRAPFRAEFGTGGEDIDFFRRMMLADHVFVWCNEGLTYEVVPPHRCTRSYMLKRALLRGRSNLKLGNARSKALLTSMVAVPAYSIVLSAALFRGHHVFMKYGIKFCDHLGRILALLGINPVKQRPM